MFDNDNSDALVLDFATDAVEPAASDYEPLPEGTYQAAISKAEIRDTRDGNGKRLVVHCKVLGPTHVGRVVIAGLNVVNRNPKAQEIARRQLAQLLQSVGAPGERDMATLIERELEIVVVVKPEQNGYPASNDIKRFLPCKAVSPTGPAPAKKAPSFMR
jgi:hypothetical protein